MHLGAEFLTVEAWVFCSVQKANNIIWKMQHAKLNTTGIAEVLGSVEMLQTEKSPFLLCNFPWLKNELMFAVVCVHLHQNRRGAGARACFLFLPLST